MTENGSDRASWIRELGDIQQRLVNLGNGSENADSIPETLRALGLQVARLIKEMQGSDTLPEGGPGSKVILVVDDNDELREFVRHALELADYNVLEAGSGNQTMTLLQEVSDLDLVICDVILPGIKGPDLLKQIRSLFPKVKTIFMSGYITEDIISQDVEQILTEGGLFLQKPFPTRKLLETVHDMLGV